MTVVAVGKSQPCICELKKRKYFLLFQSELSEIENKVNSARDTVEVQMHTFLAREGEIGRILLKYFELKREYHRRAAEKIDSEEEKFRTLLESAISPVFGSEIDVHLKRTGAQIALPIRSCVCRLLQVAKS